MRLFELENRKNEFIGTCKNSFDEDGLSKIRSFTDVSDFAVVDEQSQEISREEFLLHNDIEDWLQRQLNADTVVYMYHADRDIYMLYGVNEDIHYFFA